MRREATRWASLAGWLLAAILTCVSSIAFATPDRVRGDEREWIEFKAAPGIGRPGGAWLRAPELGYADIGARMPTSLATSDEPESDASVPAPWKRSPTESTYVDIGRELRR